MKRPIIGITTSQGKGGDTQVLNCSYVEAVERAGGCPLLMPMTQSSETSSAVVEYLDGLIITGGPGITEGLVGVLPDDLPPTGRRRRLADSHYFARTHQLGKPILGICYGMQFINARLGGTIFADLQAQCGVGAHASGRNGGKPVLHQVHLVASTHLDGLVESQGKGVEVNSHHIQAIERLGAGLQVNARSADGWIEGFETVDGRIIGVQFHPERMPGTVWDGLFEHLIQRAALLV